MTLCIAWRYDKKISICSDSRLSISATRFTDVGIKILSVPAKIGGPMNVKTGDQRDVVYNKNIGICYAGDGITSYLLKEYLQHAIRLAQYKPEKADISFVQVCNYVVKYLTYLASEIKAGLQLLNLHSDFLITGLCPKENVVKAYLINLIDKGKKVDIKISEALPNHNDFICLGSGASIANPELNKLPQHRSLTDYLDVLKKVINDPADPYVGGLMQFGTFSDDYNFNLEGLVDYKEVGGKKVKIFSYRGIDFHEAGINTDDWGDLKFLPGFISPYHKEFEDNK